MSRPYLSAKFSREAGISLTDFILKQKNGGGEAPSSLFGQISRSNKFLPRVSHRRAISQWCSESTPVKLRRNTGINISDNADHKSCYYGWNLYG